MTLKVSNVRKVLSIATALTIWGLSPSEAQTSSSVLQSLPAAVQKEIEDVRAACREYHENGPSADRAPDYDLDGLTVFTVSGRQAVMVDQKELCGDNGAKGITHSNRGGSSIQVYVRFGKTWKKVLEENSVGEFFLILFQEKFRALVLSILQEKFTPNRDVVVKWNGTKFTYKPL